MRYNSPTIPKFFSGVPPLKQERNRLQREGERDRWGGNGGKGEGIREERDRKRYRKGKEE
jgi:hypothetical protein